jgi:hypothetical protein
VQAGQRSRLEDMPRCCGRASPTNMTRRYCADRYARWASCTHSGPKAVGCYSGITLHAWKPTSRGGKSWSYVDPARIHPPKSEYLPPVVATRLPAPSTTATSPPATRTPLKPRGHLTDTTLSALTRSGQTTVSRGPTTMSVCWIPPSFPPVRRTPSTRRSWQRSPKVYNSTGLPDGAGSRIVPQPSTHNEKAMAAGIRRIRTPVAITRRTLAPRFRRVHRSFVAQTSLTIAGGGSSSPRTSGARAGSSRARAA